MSRLERVRPAPRRRGDVPVWKFAGAGARVQFLGRGAPARESPALSDWLPDGSQPAWLEQVHSTRVVVAAAGCAGAADGLRVEQPDLVAVVATADCVPVVIGGGGTVLAVHAGWRGLAGGIVGAAATTLARPGEAVAWIGPAIGPCCYEVGDEVAAAVVAAADGAVEHRGPRGRPHLDLAGAAAHQLLAAGVGRVVTLEHCTRCRAEWLWSYRAEGTSAGRNLALAWLDGDSAAESIKAR